MKAKIRPVKWIVYLLVILGILAIVIVYMDSRCQVTKGKLIFSSNKGQTVVYPYILYSPTTSLRTFLSTNDSGIARLYLESGQMVGEYGVSNGLRHGTARAWNKDGIKVLEALYVFDKINGCIERWYDNGQKEYAGEYVKGVKDGRHLSWYDTGIQKSVLTYENGLLHGASKEWMPDGHIIADSIYSNMWTINGTTIIEWVEGKPPVLGIYSNGLLLEKRKWRAQD